MLFLALNLALCRTYERTYSMGHLVYYVGKVHVEHIIRQTLKIKTNYRYCKRSSAEAIKLCVYNNPLSINKCSCLDWPLTSPITFAVYNNKLKGKSQFGINIQIQLISGTQMCLIYYYLHKNWLIHSLIINIELLFSFSGHFDNTKNVNPHNCGEYHKLQNMVMKTNF